MRQCPVDRVKEIADLKGAAAGLQDCETLRRRAVMSEDLENAITEEFFAEAIADAIVEEAVLDAGGDEAIPEIVREKTA